MKKLFEEHRPTSQLHAALVKLNHANVATPDWHELLTRSESQVNAKIQSPENLLDQDGRIRLNLILDCLSYLKLLSQVNHPKLEKRAKNITMACVRLINAIDKQNELVQPHFLITTGMLMSYRLYDSISIAEQAQNLETLKQLYRDLTNREYGFLPITSENREQKLIALTSKLANLPQLQQNPANPDANTVVMMRHIQDFLKRILSATKEVQIVDHEFDSNTRQLRAHQRSLQAILTAPKQTPSAGFFSGVGKLAANLYRAVKRRPQTNPLQCAQQQAERIEDNWELIPKTAQGTF